MKSSLKISIIVLLFSGICQAQVKNKKTVTKSPANSQKLYTISGKVTQTSSYCGGAAPPEELLEDLAKPRAYPGKTFYIKKGNKNNLKEAVVLNFKTDANGKFSFQLAPGIYSVLLEPQIKTLKLNDYNKTGNTSADEDCLKKWWTNPYYLLEIKDKDISDLNFTFHLPCFVSPDVPCLQYEGPMPP